MQKAFVLDTNVILHDPMSINKFGKNEIYIPLVVIEEVDRFKRDQNENGRNARMFSRIIDELRAKGSLVNGVDLDNGGKLFLSVDQANGSNALKQTNLDLNDNIILSCAQHLKENGKNNVRAQHHL